MPFCSYPFYVLFCPYAVPIIFVKPCKNLKFLALKVPNTLAQGEALWIGVDPAIQALKARNTTAPEEAL
jgi:hypothetical protein